MGYRVIKLILGPILRLLWRPTVEGLENVPARGGALLACNHLSFVDWLFLPLVVDRPITFLAKAEYFTERGLRGALKRAFFTAAGQVPIDRSNVSAAQAALDTGKRVLSAGRLLGIYPEGTRSPDGRLYRGRVGVASLALEAGVPVFPCAVIGTFEVAPPGRRIPRLRPVHVRIGRPLDFGRYRAMSSDRFVLRSVTDEIMYEIMSLSGQEYVDVYGKRRGPARDAPNDSVSRPGGARGGPGREGHAGPEAA